MINKKLIIVTLLILCVVLSAFAAIHFARAQTIPCTVYVDPPETRVGVCQYFLIDVNIEDLAAPPIGDYDFFLYYDPSLMTPINAWDGGFLAPPLLAFDWEYYENYVHVWGTSEGGAVGSGTLATIQFHCLAPGYCTLWLDVMLSDIGGYYYSPETVLGGAVYQYYYWEPVKLIGIVEYPYPYLLVDIPFVVPSSPEGYTEVLTYLEDKGYEFDPAEGTASKVYIESEEGEAAGIVTSWWSNTLEDGTRACMLSYEPVDVTDDPGMATGFVTNLLPPEQVPEVDPFIIVNAQPYLFVRFYWWAWSPIGRIVSYSYWWYDSHHHPNWFWGPFWWWRMYVKSYYWPYVDVPYWRPWWGWWWHWVYWRHWYWWSTYFPYDP